MSLSLHDLFYIVFDSEEKIRSRLIRSYRSHTVFYTLTVFIVVWAVTSILYYLRFPQNFLYPNFFAEDGQHFTQNILDHGFLAALFTTFNGYFICGIYLLTGSGFVIDHLLFGGQFLNLPASLALISYGFLGLCCALPIVLLRGYISLYYRLAIAITASLLPMPSFDYATIGTIGNLKFAFAYVAFLLVLYRIRLPRSSRLIILTDIGILISLFTIAEAYAVLPFILLTDGLKVPPWLKRSNWRSLLAKNNISLWSFIALICLGGGLQIIIVAARGVPVLHGYLDQPYEASKTVEIFIARVFLYPFIAAGYRHLNDVLVVTLFTLALLIAFKWGRREHWWIYLFGLFTIFAATAVFVFNRTGVSAYYNHYTGSGFDNFFYAQNLIALVLAFFVVADLSHRLNWFRAFRLALLFCLVVVFGSLYTNASHAPNDFMAYEIGTIQQQAQLACSNTAKHSITFSVYPFTFLTMTEPRSRICSAPRSDYEVGLQSFNMPTLADDPLNIFPGQHSFYQTFVASQNNLNGLAIYLSTYYQTYLKGYQLLLMDSGCNNRLRVVSLPSRVHDNAYRLIEFSPIINSLGQTYCFTILPDTDKAQQLAVQLSNETTHKAGNLYIDHSYSNSNIVFEAVYSNR